MNKYKLTIFKTPSGKWTFVGSVPIKLLNPVYSSGGKNPDYYDDILFNSKKEAIRFAEDKEIEIEEAQNV